MSRAGAKPKPMGEVPKTEVTPPKDVQSDPSPEKAILDPELPKETLEVDEADLDALDKQQSVPYGRFKEINEKAKTFQKQLEEKERDFETRLRKAEEDAELRIQARLTKQKQESEDYESDPTTRELNKLVSKIQTLEGELTHLRGESKQDKLQRTLKELEQEYPEADSLAVLGWAKTRYGTDPKREHLEELMAMSHERQNEKIRQKIQSMIEAKKKKKVSVLPTRESGPRFKPEEQPKTVQQAYAAYKKYIASGGE